MRIQSYVGLILIFFFIVNAIFAEEREHFSRKTPVVIALEKVESAIVNISTEKIITLTDPFFDLPTRRARTTSLGSGTIIHPDGYIITNNHVISKATKIHVKLQQGDEYDGTIIATDPSSDIALIKIEGKKPFPTVKMGTSEDLLIGETVIAVGNPFGLQNTATIGVVSAKGRSILASENLNLEDLIQTDTSINPGNSGGPLLNINGEIIGVNTLIKADAHGIGFAIAIDKVKEVLKEILDLKMMKKAWLGIKTGDIIDTSTKFEITKYVGVKIEEVEKNSPADKLDLKKDDQILRLNDKEIANSIEFVIDLLSYNVADVVKLNLRRGEKTFTVEITLEETPVHPAVKLAQDKLGIEELQQLDKKTAQQLGIDPNTKEIIITKLNKSERIYRVLRVGDIILKINKSKIQTLDDLYSILKNLKSGQRIRIIYYSVNEKTFYEATFKIK